MTKYREILRLVRYVRMAYECPKCKHSNHPYIIKALTPTSLMNHSLASPSSVANVMYQKYVNSVPLYRQEKDWEQLGISLSRATMANWVIRCSPDYLYPVIEHLRKELLSREVIHCDETPVQVLKEEGKKPQTQSYMWLYRTGKAYSEGSRNNMYQAVLRCDELDDERYEKLILSFGYNYTKFSVEGLALNKLLILVKVHMIRMTESNLKFLRTEYPDALQAFIQKNIEEYIILVQEKGIFEKEELVYLLVSYPTGIKTVDDGISKLAAEHIEYAMRERLLIDLGLMKILLSGEMLEKDQRKELIALYLPEMKSIDVIECLKIARLDKFYSIFIGKRPAFEMTESNEKLLNALENNHLISSFSEDKQNEGYYKAYGKRR